MDQIDRLGETWMPWTLVVESSFCSSACAAQPLYHVLLQLYGERRVRTQREVGLIEQSWRGRARAGGRKENTGRWFACCPDEMFLSFGDFRAFRCGHLKAGSGLGQSCKASGCSCWVLVTSSYIPQRRAPFGVVHRSLAPARCGPGLG